MSSTDGRTTHVALETTGVLPSNPAGTVTVHNKYAAGQRLYFGTNAYLSADSSGNLTISSVTLIAAGLAFTELNVTSGTITTNNPVLDATQTWNASGITFYGLQLAITDTDSSAGSKVCDFTVGGTSMLGATKAGLLNAISLALNTNKFTVDGSGNVVVAGTLGVTGLSSLDGGININDRLEVNVCGDINFKDVSGNSKMTITTSTGDIGTDGAFLAAGLSSLDGGINVSDTFTVSASGVVYTPLTIAATGAISSSGAISAASTLTAGTTVTGATINSSGNITAVATITGATVNSSGAITAVGTITGATVNSSGGITAIGTVLGATVNSSGSITAGSTVTATTTVTGATLNSSGAITAVGTITGATINSSGAVTAGSTITATTTITGATVNSSGGMTAVGTMTCATFNCSGAITAGSTVTATTIVTGATVNSSGDMTAVGTITCATLNCSGTVTGAIVNSSGGMTAVGTVLGATVNSSGAMTAITTMTCATLNCSGTVTGATVNSSGDMTAVGTITAATINSSGAITAVATITGATVNSSGAMTAVGTMTCATLNCSGTVTGATVNSSGDITAVGTVLGAVVNSSGAMTAVGTITCATLNCSGTITGAIVNSSGAMTAVGTITGATVTSSGAVNGATLDIAASTMAVNASGDTTVCDLVLNGFRMTKTQHFSSFIGLTDWTYNAAGITLATGKTGSVAYARLPGLKTGEVINSFRVVGAITGDASGGANTLDAELFKYDASGAATSLGAINQVSYNGSGSFSVSANKDLAAAYTVEALYGFGITLTGTTGGAGATIGIVNLQLVVDMK